MIDPDIIQKDLDAKRVKSQEDRPLKKLKTSDSPSHLKHPQPGSSGSNVAKPKMKSTPVVPHISFKFTNSNNTLFVLQFCAWLHSFSYHLQMKFF